MSKHYIYQELQTHGQKIQIRKNHGENRANRGYIIIEPEIFSEKKTRPLDPQRWLDEAYKSHNGGVFIRL
jgi:hypothetical protein